MRANYGLAHISGSSLIFLLEQVSKELQRDQDEERDDDNQASCLKVSSLRSDEVLLDSRAEGGSARRRRSGSDGDGRLVREDHGGGSGVRRGSEEGLLVVTPGEVGGEGGVADGGQRRDDA